MSEWNEHMINYQLKQLHLQEMSRIKSRIKNGIVDRDIKKEIQVKKFQNELKEEYLANNSEERRAEKEKQLQGLKDGSRHPAFCDLI
jgi:hypothetical protein